MGCLLAKIFLVLVIIILIVAAFIGIEPFSSWKDTTFTTISGWWQSISTAIVGSTDVADYIKIYNDYRVSQGCQPLIFTDELNNIASLRLSEIKMYFSHYSYGNYNAYLGENIASGVNNNQHALDVWKNSFLHNANMLDMRYNYTGYAIGDGYAVQVFSY